MERHLAVKEFLVGERYSIADIALYAYTHMADEGGFDLGLRNELLKGFVWWCRTLWCGR